MKVHIITKVGFPNGMAAVNRIKCYAKAILHSGLECEVVVFTRTEVYGKKPINTEGHGLYENIPFRYIGNTPLRGSNKLIRFWNDMKDRRNLVSYIKQEVKSGDVVFAYLDDDTYYVTNKIIPAVHQVGAKYVRELCELPYGTDIENSLTIRDRKHCFDKEFPLLDGVIAISDSLSDIASQYAPQAKCLKVPILVDYDKYAMADKSEGQEIPYVFHCGTLYQQKDGILGMIEAFAMAIKQSNMPLHFYSTGNVEGSRHESEIRELISKYQLQDRIKFLGYLSNDEIRDYLCKAAMVVINKLPTQQNKYCFSTKLGEYMAASKPIIITDVGEAINWLTSGYDSIIVPTGKTAALADEINKLMSNDEKRGILGKHAQATCREKFDYRAYELKLKEFFCTIK